MCAGCDWPAYRVLRVKPWGAPLKSCHYLISSFGGEEIDEDSGHQCLLILYCTEPPVTQWKLAALGTFYPQSQAVMCKF